MTVSPFEQFCNDVMLTCDTLASSSLRSAEPYYKYGDTAFFAETGRPPQVRWRLGDGLLTNTNREVGGLGVSGSFGSWQQDFVCRVWGATEKQTYDETILLYRAIKENAPGMADIPLTWLEIDGKRKRDGEVVEFTIQVDIKTPFDPSQLVTLHTASYEIFTSASLGTPPTGSLWRDVTLTGSG